MDSQILVKGVLNSPKDKKPQQLTSYKHSDAFKIKLMFLQCKLTTQLNNRSIYTVIKYKNVDVSRVQDYVSVELADSYKKHKLIVDAVFNCY